MKIYDGRESQPDTNFVVNSIGCLTILFFMGASALCLLTAVISIMKGL